MSWPRLARREDVGDCCCYWGSREVVECLLRDRRIRIRLRRQRAEIGEGSDELSYLRNGEKKE